LQWIDASPKGVSYQQIIWRIVFSFVTETNLSLKSFGKYSVKTKMKESKAC